VLLNFEPDKITGCLRIAEFRIQNILVVNGFLGFLVSGHASTGGGVLALSIRQGPE